MKAESVNDTVSAGGTRYMIKVKDGQPAFYGDHSESQSQYSKRQPQNEYLDINSRIDYDNLSAHQSIGGGSAMNNPQMALDIISNTNRSIENQNQVLYDKDDD